MWKNAPSWPSSCISISRFAVVRPFAVLDRPTKVNRVPPRNLLDDAYALLPPQAQVLGVVWPGTRGYAAVDLDLPSLYLLPSDLRTVACDPQRPPAGLRVALDRGRNNNSQAR